MAAPLKLSNILRTLTNKSNLYCHKTVIIRGYAVGKPGSPNRLEEIELEGSFTMLFYVFVVISFIFDCFVTPLYGR